jgi:hypothetical protein
MVIDSPEAVDGGIITTIKTFRDSPIYNPDFGTKLLPCNSGLFSVTISMICDSLLYRLFRLEPPFSTVSKKSIKI